MRVRAPRYYCTTAAVGSLKVVHAWLLLEEKIQKLLTKGPARYWPSRETVRKRVRLEPTDGTDSRRRRLVEGIKVERRTES